MMSSGLVPIFGLPYHDPNIVAFVLLIHYHFFRGAAGCPACGLPNFNNLLGLPRAVPGRCACRPQEDDEKMKLWLFISQEEKENSQE